MTSKMFPIQSFLFLFSLFVGVAISLIGDKKIEDYFSTFYDCKREGDIWFTKEVSIPLVYMSWYKFWYIYIMTEERTPVCCFSVCEGCFFILEGQNLSPIPFVFFYLFWGTNAKQEPFSGLRSNIGKRWCNNAFTVLRMCIYVFMSAGYLAAYLLDRL